LRVMSPAVLRGKKRSLFHGSSRATGEKTPVRRWPLWATRLEATQVQGRGSQFEGEEEKEKKEREKGLCPSRWITTVTEPGRKKRKRCPEIPHSLTSAWKRRTRPPGWSPEKGKRNRVLLYIALRPPSRHPGRLRDREEKREDKKPP